MTENKTSDPKELLLHAQADSLVLDVRTHMEHREKRLSCPHLHIPLDDLTPDRILALPLDKTVYIVCRSGKRAQSAADKLSAAGYRDVRVIAGGLEACQLQGHKIESSGKPVCFISLERQVRIAAGVLVLIGSLCALCFDVRFAFLPLAIGAGLIFAGVTNRCGLALILTKAPWNKC